MANNCDIVALSTGSFFKAALSVSIRLASLFLRYIHCSDDNSDVSCFTKTSAHLSQEGVQSLENFSELPPVNRTNRLNWTSRRKDKSQSQHLAANVGEARGTKQFLII